MTLSYTPRLKLAIPDFLSEPWHSEFEQAMQSIDRAIYNSVLAQGAVLWTNDTAYVIGDLIISPDSGAMYTCGVSHTSAAAGTFTADSTANPTYWTTFAPSLATQAEAEAGVENTKYMSALRTSQAITALTSTTSLNNPRCGQLERTDATHLLFRPKNGDRVKVNGILYEIPGAGVVLTNAGLVANTTYLVFANISGGIVAGSFATGVTHTPSATAGNVGVEIKTGDDNYTLIGIIRTNASSQFVDTNAQRFVRSWFNAPSAALLNNLTVDVTTASATYIELSSAVRLEWVNFTSEIVTVRAIGSYGNTNAGVFANNQLTFGLDSTTVAQDVFIRYTSDSTTVLVPIGLVCDLQPAEGYHFAALLGRTDTGTLSVDIRSNAAGERTVLSGLIPARG